MGVLTTTELKDHLELVALLEEFLGMAELRLVVMRPDLHAELDLLDLAGAVLALLLFLRQLVLELAEVGDAADGGIGRRGHLDEVKAVGFGPADGLLGFQDADLLAGGADDDADLAGADAVVDADECGINGTSMRLRVAGARGCVGMRTR